MFDVDRDPPLRERWPTSARTGDGRCVARHEGRLSPAPPASSAEIWSNGSAKTERMSYASSAIAHRRSPIRDLCFAGQHNRATRPGFCDLLWVCCQSPSERKCGSVSSVPLHVDPVTSACRTPPSCVFSCLGRVSPAKKREEF